jgi:hypothetical protein
MKTLLTQWFFAIYLPGNTKNGTSAREASSNTYENRIPNLLGDY